MGLKKTISVGDLTRKNEQSKQDRAAEKSTSKPGK